MLDEIFCRCQLGPFIFGSRISLLIFFWMAYLLVIGGINSPFTTVLESICAFKTFKVYLMKLVALTFCAYRLIIAISFWCISPFIGMKCLSLSHLISVSLKSTFSDISIGAVACFQGPLTW
jgi:hypothetical protein